ncbi:MAG: hypothetical protein ABSB40_12125 [Nitrososphaeria archaeon]|jgi:hypothetical protein
MAINNAVNDIYIARNGFYATNTTSPTNVTGDGTQYTIPFDFMESGSGFDTSTYSWVPSAVGTYSVGVSLYTYGYASTNTDFLVILGGSDIITEMSATNIYDSSGVIMMSVVVPFLINAIDPGNPPKISVQLQVSGTSKNISLTEYKSSFWANLLF